MNNSLFSDAELELGDQSGESSPHSIFGRGVWVLRVAGCEKISGQLFAGMRGWDCGSGVHMREGIGVYNP